MSKKKWLISLAFVLVLSFVLVGCDNESDAIKFKNEYEALNGELSESNSEFQTLNIPEENPIKYATANEIADVIENGSGIIYFGFPQCPWCRTAVPALLDAADEANAKEILYLNMTEERDIRTIDENGDVVVEREGSEGYQRIQKLLNDYLRPYKLTTEDGKEIDTGEKRVYVPFVVVIEDGKVVGEHFYTLPIQDEDPWMSLNEKQHQELVNIYLEIFKKSSTCDLEVKC